MGTLLALVGFSFVISVTPGPNTVLLWASGASFEFRAAYTSASEPKRSTGG